MILTPTLPGTVPNSGLADIEEAVATVRESGYHRLITGRLSGNAEEACPNASFSRKKIPMRTIFPATLILSASMGLAANAGAAEWTIAPYLWAADVTLDAQVNDTSLGGEVDFADLLEKTDSVFMGHFEGRSDRWGGFFDVIYVDLSDSRTTELGPGGPLLGTASVDAGLKLNIYEAAIMYRFGNAEPGSGTYELDLFAGGRSVQVELTADISIETALPELIEIGGTLDDSHTDFLIGGRLWGYFNQRWSWIVRGDYSAGGSEGIFNTHAMIGYTFGEGLFTLTGGYRYMDLSLEGSVEGSATKTDITLAGPIVGFVFNF